MKRVTQLICIFMAVLLLIPSASAAAAGEDGVKGLDVSSYNGVVDWNAVAAQGYTYVMIKTGNGSDSGNPEADIDPYFEQNYAGARAAGLKVGVYHVCTIRTPEDAKANAELCLEILNGRELDYPVAYDIEMDGTFAGGKKNTTEIALAFCEMMENAGYTPMIYSPYKRLKDDFDWKRLEGIKVWAARYGAEPFDLPVDCDMWQFTKEAKVEGANTNNGRGSCDLNYSYMEAQDLTLSKTKITLGKGETYTVKAEMAPELCTDTIKWKSSDKSVVTVNSAGKITAKGTGSATVTAVTGSGQKAEIKVTVKKAPKSVGLEKTSKTVKKGKTYQVKPVIKSGYASYKITYSSSNKSVAAVSSKGVVTGKKKGTATITVKTFNGKTVKCKITVK